MKVASILAEKGDAVATISPSAGVHELVDVLFINGIGAVVVSDDGSNVSGIVSERDVVKALAAGRDLKATSVAEVMTTEVFTATVDTTVGELMARMTQSRIRHIPIVDEDDQLVGIVSIGDVVKRRLDELEDERAALSSYITQGG